MKKEQLLNPCQLENITSFVGLPHSKTVDKSGFFCSKVHSDIMSKTSSSKTKVSWTLDPDDLDHNLDNKDYIIIR